MPQTYAKNCYQRRLDNYLLLSEVMYATRCQISCSLSVGHDGMSVPGTPFRMARNVRPAAAASDHGGSVRFAGVELKIRLAADRGRRR